MTALNRIWRPALCVVAAVILGGCVNLDPKPDRVQLFTLGPVGQAPAIPADDARRIFIARPNLPEFLESKYLHFRNDDGRLQRLSDARWAEPIEDSVARAIAELLARDGTLRPTGFYPWPEPTEPTAIVALSVHRMDATEDGLLFADISWRLKAPSGPPAAGRIRPEPIRWTPGDPASLVAAWNGALRQVAQRLASEVGESL